MDTLFDPRRAARNRARFDPACAFAHRWAGERLCERLGDVARDFPLALSTDPRTPLASPKIGRLLTLGRDVLWGQESLPFKGLDLVISPASLHTAGDLPGALSQIRAALNPGGLFLAALPGRGTLGAFMQALAQAEWDAGRPPPMRVAPLPEAGQMAGLMGRAGFALPVVDIEVLRVSYPDVLALARDLRGMGERSPLAHIAPATRGLFARAQALHPKEPDGRIEAIFEVVFCIGWAGLRGPRPVAHKGA